MVIEAKTKRLKKASARQYSFRYKRHRFRVLIDKFLIFRLLRRLHGRFWGIAGAIGLSIGVGICFLIRPDLFVLSTAISDFGSDVRTAPYFAGAVFFAAYGLWRWRNYLKRTLKRTKPILWLLNLTILGLYVVALMPVSWDYWPARIHIIAMTITGISAAATVVFDILLSKTPRGHNANTLRFVKMVSFIFIVVGGWLTLGSSHWLEWFNIALPAEFMLLGGYFIWIILKTYQGEDPRSSLSRLLKKVILVD
jgi:multisubunit Na+/H+ antiporter MnhG subunit